MSKKLLLVPVIFVIALIALNFGRYNPLSSENEIFVSGNIEVTEVDVSFKVPGRVSQRFANEGEPVKKGQPLARLEQEELKQEVALREAEVLAAQAALDGVKHGFRKEEVAQAEARLRQAQADLSSQKNEFERQQELFNEEVISSREFDRAKSAYEVALAKKEEAEESLSLLRSGYRKEKIEEAQAKWMQAKEGLKLAKIHLRQSRLLSPIDGYVISDNVEPGEVVAAGTPVLTIGNIQKPWLRAFMNQTDLGKVHLGQKVMVHADAFPGRTFEGRIAYISPRSEFTPKNIQTEEERVKLVYRIKVELESEGMELKPGMPAQGLIVLSDEE